MISCKIIGDLLPLVQDGVASEESEALVRAHCASCPHCRALWEGKEAVPCAETPSAAGFTAREEQALLRRVRQRAYLPLSALLVLGACVGVGLSGTMGQFYNLALMPLVGVCGYALFRWRGCLLAPAAVLALSLLTAFLPQSGPLSSPLLYGLLYAVLVLAGELAAGLLHYAVKGEGKG